mgnify:FL=1
MLHFLMLAAVLLDGGTIQGTVRVQGPLEPIAGATIRVPQLDRVVLSDAHGYFVLSDVPAGRWQVEASAIGHETNTLTIESSGQGMIRLDFELALRPVELPGIEVETTAEAEGAGIVAPSPVVVGPTAIRARGPALKLVPGLAEPDILRALQTLPSVAAISDFSSALYVRGGSADQNLITLDGVPLFNPYHVGGIFSAIGVDAVSTVDVWAGAFPASAGDRLSSNVEIHTRQGGKDRVRARGAVGLISTHATVDGPLPGGGGSFLLSARRTYLDAMSDVAYALDLIPATIPYGFSDVYLKSTHEVGEMGAFSVSAYLNREGIHLPRRMREELDGDYDFGWGSKMLSLAYRRPIAGSLLLHARAGYSDFRGTFDAWEIYWRGPINCWGSGDCDYSNAVPDTIQNLLAHTTARDLLAGADLTWYGRNHTVRTGLQVDAYLFDHSVAQVSNWGTDPLSNFDRADRVRTLAAYVEDEWKPTDRLSVRAGLRMLDGGGHGRAWMPRLGARFQLSPSIALSLGGGRYAQVLRNMKDDESVWASIIAYDILTAQPEDVGLATGEDLVVGAEWTSARTRIRLDAYTRWLDGLVLAPEPEDPWETPPLIVDEYRVGTGTTRGLEAMIDHRLGRVDLTLAYAFTRAERRVDGETFPPRFERRHVLDASAMLPLGERGFLSARFALGTGQPYAPAIGIADPFVYDAKQGRWAPASEAVLLGDHNSDRLPGYFRLDVAARKSYQKNWFGRRVELTPYLQILNVLNTKNVLVGEARAYGPPEITYAPQLPILPTIGVEWRF